MRYAKIVNNEIILYSKSQRIEYIDHYIDESTTIEGEIKAILFEGWKIYTEKIGFKNDIYETETEIVKTFLVTNPTQKEIIENNFDYNLCSTELLKRFTYEFIFCTAESLAIQALVQSKLKPFKAIAQMNYTFNAQNRYPEGLDTYNRLNALFLEQNIDLSSYL